MVGRGDYTPVEIYRITKSAVSPNVIMDFG
jgi:hypothetical protein